MAISLVIWPDRTRSATIRTVIQHQNANLGRYGYTIDSSDEERAKILYGRFMAYPPAYSDKAVDWQRGVKASAPFRPRCLLLDAKQVNWPAVDFARSTFFTSSSSSSSSCSSSCSLAHIPFRFKFDYEGRLLSLEEGRDFYIVNSKRMEQRIVLVLAYNS